MVTIAQFQDAFKVQDDFYKAYAILKGITEEQAKHIPISELTAKTKWVAEVLNPPKDKGIYMKWFRLGWRFYRVPYSISDLTAEQYITLTTLVDKGIEPNLHLIITAMIYKGKNPKKFAERLRKNVDYKLAYGMAVFFWEFWKVLQSSVQISLKEKEERVGSKNTGDGK